MTLKKLLLAGATLAALGGAAIAQSGSMGTWSNLPAVGTQSLCSAYVNGNCVQFVGPGESTLTGNERIPNDTNLPGGQSPQTQVLTVANLAQQGQGAERNTLRGGDFFTNLWQRGVTFASVSPTTTTMTADGWGVYSSGNVATVAKDTTAADLSPTLGINAAVKITRPSGTNTTAICFSQVLAQKESERFIGREAIFSFYANALSGYLATNKQIIATLAVYTASDSATPGTNTDAFAKGTITGYTVINPTSVSVTTAPAINLTSAWVRYAVSGAVPTTIGSNPVIGIGVQICTPVYPASTGVAGDGFLLANLQLEDSTPGTTVSMTGPGTSTLGVNSQTVTLAPANTIPGSFARRSTAAEAALELSYSYVLTDGAVTRAFPGFCTETTANTSATCAVPFGTQMREVPTTTVSATGWSIQQASNNADELCSALAGVSTSNTISSAALLCTNPGTMAVGLGSAFYGGATTSTITFSAEP